MKGVIGVIVKGALQVDTVLSAAQEFSLPFVLRAQMQAGASATSWSSHPG